MRRALAAVVSVVLSCTGLTVMGEAPSSAAPGDLDATFGTAGVVFQTPPSPPGPQFRTGIAVSDLSGRILQGGSDPGPGGSRDSVVARLTADGQPDPTFNGGTPGLEFDAFGGNEDDRISGLAVDPETGDVYVASTRGNGGTELDGYVRVERLDPNGARLSVSRTFGPGMVDGQLAFSNGRLMMASTYSTAGGPDFDGVYIAAMAAADLSPDTSFADTGQAVATAGLRTVFQALAVDSSGRVLVGAHQGAGTTGAQLFRFTANGFKDGTFGGGDGQVLVRVTGDDWITSIAPNIDGRIAVAGRAFPDSHVTLLDDAGNPITTFDGDGSRLLTGAIWTVAWDRTGNLVYGQESGGVIGRLQQNGADDTSFGTRGRSAPACPPGNQGDRQVSLLVQSTRVISAGDCGSTMFAAGFQINRAIAALTYTVSRSAAAGRERIDLTTLDLASLGGGFEALQSAPLRASPLRGSPLRASPLRASPLRASPLRASPLRASPLRASPLRASPFPIPVPLSTVPLVQETPGDPTWSDVLIGTSLAGAPLQSVTLQQVFAAPDSVAPTVNDLSLAAIDLSQSPLRGASFAATFLWGIPLSALPPPNYGGSWCAFLAIQTAGPDCANPNDPGTTDPVLGQYDLLDLELAGIDLGSYYGQSISLIGVPLRASPTNSSPLGNVFLRDFALDNTPLKNLPTSNAAVHSLLTCGGSCPPTIGAAQDANNENIAPDARVADLVAALPVGAVADVTLGELLAGLLDASQLPFDRLPLRQLLDQAVLRTTGNLLHTLAYNRDCSVPGEPTVTVSVPDQTRVVPGSAKITVNGGASTPVADPGYTPGSEGPPSFDFTIPPSVCGTSTAILPMVLTFDAEPPADLGSYSTTAYVSTPTTNDSVTAATASVVDAADATDDNPATPTLVNGSTLYTGHVSHPGDVDYWRIPAPPTGSRVTVTLSHLPADFDLVVYGSESDIPSTPLRASPLRASPLRASPVGETSNEPNADPSTLPPEGLADVPLRASPVRGTSITRGDTTESVTTTSRSADSAGGFDIQVSGFDGAFSDRPYVLQVKVTDGPPARPCFNRAYGTGGVQGTALSSVPASTETLILVNQQRMGDIYGAAPVSSMMGSLTMMAAKPAVRGAIVPVDSDPGVRSAYAAWDAAECSPSAANNVVSAINRVVDGLRPSLPNLRSVVIVGSDEVVPQGRVSDLTGVSNQLEYTEQARFNDLENPISAAFLNGYVLSDEPYGDFDPQPWLSGRFYVSDVALGRVVESPAEVKAVVDRYNGDADGALDPTTGFVAGYDFLKDGAQRILGSVQTKAPSATSQINETWTAQQALAGINASAGGFTSVNAHYDHHEALPADSFNAGTIANLLTTGQLSQSLAGSLLFTIGCEAGLNIPDVLVANPAATPEVLDWAQRTNQLGGTFTGNSGYGYGDTDTVAYSERLMAYYAENLASGKMTVGQALMFAKQRFNGELGVAGVYDAKVLEESMTFGLPFWKVGASGTQAPPALPALPPASDPALIASTAPFSPAISTQQVNGTRGTFWQVPGHLPQVTHSRPIEPRLSQQFPPTGDGQRIHGVVIESMASTDVPNVDPDYSTPTIDLSANEPEAPTRDVVFPAALQAVNHVPTPTGPKDEVVLMPGQFFSDPDGSGRGTQRLFSSLGTTLYRSNSTDFTPPTISTVEALEQADGKVRIDVTSPSTDTVRAVALYRFGDFGSTNPTWHEVDLAPAAGGRSATVTPVAGTSKVVDLVIQLVDTAGNVGITSNKGPGYQSEPRTALDAPTLASDPGIPPSGAVAAAPTFTVQGYGVYEVQIDGRPYVPAAGPFLVPGEGAHTVVARAVGGTATSTATFITDLSPPQVTITSPANGATYARGAVPAAAYACTDAVSGIATCEASPLDQTVGSHTFSVTGTDKAGRSTTVTARYVVTEGTDITGYRVAGADGSVFAYGNVPFYGSMGGARLNRPIVGIEQTATKQGYWLVASDGGIFSFGDAIYYGSTGGLRLNQPILGMARTATGNGYWLVAADGGIFSYGDAKFFGSTGALHLNQPIVGMARTKSGNGYWLVAADGGIFTFGDAQYLGSTGALKLVKPVVGMARSESGNGYWLVASDGGIFSYGDATFWGSAAGSADNRFVGMARARDTHSQPNAYWLITAAGRLFGYGGVQHVGDPEGTPLKAPIVGIADVIS